LPFKKENRTIKFLSLFTIVVFLIVLAFNYSFFENYINIIDSRILAEKQLGSSRSAIFYYYFLQLISDPRLLLFGYGINTYFYKIGFSGGPHNLILEPFLAWGVIGVFSLYYLLKQIVKSSSLSSNVQHISLLTSLPLGFFIIQSLVSSVWAEAYFYLFLVFCIQILFIKQNTA
jgi:hypothetical protein